MDNLSYMSRYTEDENGCWNYTGSINPAGYGQIRQTTAHRFFWETIRGPIPVGLQLDHLCRNKRCVNPLHLEPVTGAENMRRRSEAYTVCGAGHRMDEENTIVKKRANRISRECRACQVLAQRRYRENRKGAPMVKRRPFTDLERFLA